MFRYIEPEVSGELGKDTIRDNSVHPPIISRLHYQFDGWLGNDLLESFPCFIVTDRLKLLIEKNGLDGITFDVLKVSKSSTFQQLYPNKQLPTFHWIKVIGHAGVNDFGIAKDLRLVISEKALDILNSLKIDRAILEDYIDK